MTADVVDVAGVPVAQRVIGTGPPVVFLHGEDGLVSIGGFLAALGRQRQVLAPSHPGWGVSPDAAHVRSIDDLSYVYLDYLERVGARVGVPVAVVGTSLGGWLAAAVATKSCAGIAALVLVSPVGIKVGGREERDFVDLYACSHEAAAMARYGSSPPDLAALDRREREELIAAQAATARCAWEPYMHDPHLAARLHRITVPTMIVWDRDDRFVRDPASYYEAYRRAIGENASTVAMATGAHDLDAVAPAALADAVVEFLGRSGS